MKINQSKCIDKAKESLVILLKFKLLAVVTGVVFENLFKDGEDWNKAEEIRGIAPGIKIHLNHNQFDIVNGGSASKREILESRH